jgi:hypothetical protein
MLYLLIGFLLVRGIIFLMPKTRQKKLAKDRLIKATNKVMNSMEDQNPYLGLRGRVFSATPDELNLVLDITKTSVFAVVMDWDMGDVIMTVVAFQTGDASLYLSSGQIFIGGYTREKINRAALMFVNEAQKYLLSTTLTYTNPLPEKGCVRFYLRTNKGDYTIQENMTNLENRSSKFGRLFKLGNNLITEYRMLDNEKEKND